MISIHILTPETLIKKDGKKVNFPTRKCMGIFTFLVIHKKELVSRDRLASIYWGDFPEERARRNLNDTLWRLKKMFKEEGINDKVSIYSDRSHISIILTEEAYIDLDSFYDFIQQSRKQKILQQRIKILEKAIGIGTGSLLYELDEPWLEPIRSNYLNSLVQAKIELINSYKTIGNYPKALNITKSTLKENPYDESLAYELVLLYYLSGERSRAIEEFNKFDIKLRSQLGIKPGEKLNNLISSITSNNYFTRENTEEPEAKPLIPEKTPLIGRNKEIKKFKTLYNEVVNNNICSCLLIKGTAGSGKTHFLNNLINFSDWHNSITIYVECNKIDEPPTYMLISSIIQKITDILSISVVEELPAHYLYILSRLAPEIKGAIEDEEEYNHFFFERFEKNYLYQAIERLFKITAKEKPIVILIDDLHWADKESCEILLSLMVKITGHSILLVMTARPELEYKDFYYKLLDLYRPEKTGLITLLPLSLEAISQVVNHLLGLKKYGFQGTQEELAKKLHLETGGNPLFIRETIRYWLEKKILDFNKINKTWSFTPPLNCPVTMNEELPDSINMPERIFNIFKARISILDDNLKDFIELAAILGYEFNVNIIQIIFEKSEDEVVQILDILIKKGILNETAETDIVRFSHRKQREFLYFSISNLKRTLLHKKIYLYLANNQSELIKDYENRLEDLAWHSYKANLWQEAVKYNLKSGNQLFKESNFFKASYYFNRAYKITTNKKINPEIVITILEKRATIALLTGDNKNAQMTLDKMTRWAQKTNNKQAEGRAYALLAQLRTWTGNFKTAKKHLQRAIGLGKTMKDYDIILKSLHMLSLIAQMPADRELALTVSDELNIIINEINKTENKEALKVLSLALFIKGQHLVLFGNIEQALSCLQESEKIIAKHDEKHNLAFVTGNIGMIYCFLYNLETGLEKLNQSLNQARKNNNVQALSFTLLFLLIVYRSRGEYKKTFDCLKELEKLTISHPYFISGSLAIGGELYFHLGDLLTAEEYLTECLQFSEKSGIKVVKLDGLSTLGLLRGTQGKLKEGREMLDKAYSEARKLPLKWLYCSILLKSMLHELITGNYQQVEREAEKLLKDYNGKGFEMQGWAAYGLGVVNVSKGNFYEATHYLLEALNIGEITQVLPLRWYTQKVLADIYLINFDIEKARKYYQSAARILEKIVAELPEERLKKTFLNNPSVKKILLRGQSRLAEISLVYNCWDKYNNYEHTLLTTIQEKYGHLRKRRYQIAGIILQLETFNLSPDPEKLAIIFDRHHRTITRDIKIINPGL